jgi:hypothetical protein
VCSPGQRGSDCGVPESSTDIGVRFQEPFAELTIVLGWLQERWSVAENQENAMSSSQSPEKGPVIPARQARQGVIGHNVRFVLGFSLAAVVIVFAVIWLVYFA